GLDPGQVPDDPREVRPGRRDRGPPARSLLPASQPPARGHRRPDCPGVQAGDDARLPGALRQGARSRFGNARSQGLIRLGSHPARGVPMCMKTLVAGIVSSGRARSNRGISTGNQPAATAGWIVPTFWLLLAVVAAFGQASTQDAQKPLYKTTYRVVDVHTHWGAPREEAVAAEIDVMDRMNLAAAVNLDAGRTDGTLPAWMKLKQSVPSRIAVFAKFTKKDFERVREPGFFDDLVRELEKAAKMGNQGVKIGKDLGMLIEEGPGQRLRS